MFEGLEKNMVEVVDDVLPCVVSVSTTVLARVDLFKVQPVQGQGSGVIFDEDGIIVTNGHVVKNATAVEVQLHGGKRLKAKVLGKMRGQDIAFLQVDKDSELEAIKIGDSSSLKVGQFALAIGNPLGLGKSVTFGMISALNRTISAEKMQLEGLIQTTADINPGNSGGALVNTQGELIGINTAVIQHSQGLGFAIAIDSIKGVLEEFRDTKTISTPWMGVVGYTIDKKLATYYKLPVEKGALLLDIPKGPAKEAGLIIGDIIVGLNDEEIISVQILTQKIVKRRIGDEVKITYYRKGKKSDMKITLGKAPLLK
ncbi:MAG: S1C family serine protease [Candidatus Heimdallarchaeota archaeon]